MTRSLVIQLGRLGDIIQTTPLLSELAAAGDAVDVLVLHSAHEVLLGCPAVANIITLADSLKSLDDAIACGFPHGKFPADAHELLFALRLPRYDRIVNASHAPLGCWLANAVPCANPNAIFGGIVRDRECLYLGAASAYRIAMLQFREQNLFNLVDLLRAAPGIAPQSAPPRIYANQSPNLPFPLPKGRRVALNPGASDPARCWPAENFARLAEVLSSAGFVPLLVGAPSERSLCEKIAAEARIAIPNFAGSTTIPETATLLANCELLISADTGAAHLAAAVGTTVLGLYGHTAWFAETAPYGNAHLILQSPLNAPTSAISSDAALAAALNRLGCLSLTELRREFRHELRRELGRELGRQNQSAWETSIQPPSPPADPLGANAQDDPLGGLIYRPLHRDSLTPDELFARSLRQAFATEFLTKTETDALTVPDLRAIDSAPSTGSAGILAGSEATQPSPTTFDPSRNTHPLPQILTHMQTLATLCAESTRTRPASSETATAASSLITTMEKLRAVAAEPAWHPLAPVIHYLDWQLRMLPPQSPEQTFRAHANAYASATHILQSATRSSTEAATPRSWTEMEKIEVEKIETGNERFDWKGITTGGKEGGQVPSSVRIQAPARRRGSVSP